MNEAEEIEMATSKEEMKKPKKRTPRKPKKNREVHQQQIDLTIDDDLREIEDYKEEDHQYDPYDRYERDEHENYKQNDYDDEDEELIPSDFPSIPKKTILWILILIIVGLGLIVAGILSYLHHESTGKVIFCILFGLLVISPGCIYGLFLIQALYASSPEEKEEILEQIPI